MNGAVRVMVLIGTLPKLFGRNWGRAVVDDRILEVQVVIVCDRLIDRQRLSRVVQ